MPGLLARALPVWVPYAVVAILVVVVAGWGYGRGASVVQDRWDKATAEQSSVVALVRQRQAEVTERVVTQYVDRVRVIERAADAVIREVPVYVQDRCEPDGRLPAGVRWVLNAAACAGRCPAEPAGSADGAGPGSGAASGQH